MTLARVYELLKDKLLCEPSRALGADADKEIADVAYDSRRVRPGFVFTARDGARLDGHAYIPEAVQRGAAAVVCEAPAFFELYRKRFPHIPFFCVKSAGRALALLSAEHFSHPATKLTLIGITGTKGKTGTSVMLADMLTRSGIDCALIGTNGVYYGDIHEESENSTPASYELHRIFAETVARGIKVCIMEVTSQALKHERVYGLTFDVAVFTNLSPDHIGKGEHESFEEYRACKEKLFTVCRRALINADDEASDRLRGLLEERHVPYQTFSTLDPSADFYGCDERYYTEKSHMKTAYTLAEKDGGRERIQVNVPGRFAIYNSLCAAAVARSFGVSHDCIRTSLESIRIRGRTEAVGHPKARCPILIDYAHNALSAQSLFDAVRAYRPKRILCVFGCGGNRSRLRRFAMGEIAGKNAELSIVTSDNPRDEDPDAIMADILAGLSRTGGKYRLIRDRAAAIEYALEQSREGDIVLLMGKGQQTFEEVGGVKYAFDEREVVRKYWDSL